MSASTSTGHTHGGLMQGHSARQAAVTKKARYAPQLKHAKISFAGVTPSLFVSWLPVLGIWGVGAGAGLALYLSDIPKFKNDVLLKIPVLKEYFADKTPDSDKPF